MSLFRDIFFGMLVLAGLIVGTIYYKVQSVLKFDERTKCTERGGIIVRGENGDGWYCVKEHT